MLGEQTRVRGSCKAVAGVEGALHGVLPRNRGTAAAVGAREREEAVCLRVRRLSRGPREEKGA